MRDILTMENITKVYSNGFAANKNVSLSVREGEIHALVGENGAGKSTLMKVLFGAEKPDEGRILLRGEPIRIDSPTDAISHGIGMVYQHFMLAPSLTVAENVVVGMEPSRFGFFSIKRAAALTREASDKYGLKLNPLARVQDLPVGQKQKIEILKALVRGARILILDEPTAVLTPQETRELFRELKALREQKYTVIFISHKLGEVMELCDRVTVLRAGRTIGVECIENVGEAAISRMMVGRDVTLEIKKQPPRPGNTVLNVRGVEKPGSGGRKILGGVSFRVRAGEILGVAGVEGNGQKELSEIIAGMDKDFSGEVYACGQDVRKSSIRELREAGVAHISEDRMTYGIVGGGRIDENIIADRYYTRRYQKGPLLDLTGIKRLAGDLIHSFGVKCDGPEQPVRMLSGGNMQKVVAAREFTAGAKLMLANQPTRGIDVGASEFIRNRLVELRDAGAGILLISADLGEVMEVSDSLIVMHDGKIAAYIKDAKSITEDELGEYMLGVRVMGPEQIEEVAGS